MGFFRTPDDASRQFVWPSATEVRAVEKIADDYPPYRHPLGRVQTDLKPRNASSGTSPVQFLARYNPRAMSQVRITGGYNDGYDLPIVGNWAYIFESMTSWYDGGFAVSAGGNGYWGDDNDAGGEEHVVLFELPTAPLQSLAAFQHVNNISRYAQEPAYVIGSSYASPFISRDSMVEEPSTTNKFTQVDWSYFSNEALWDTYFFSSLTPREDLSEDFEDAFSRYLAGDPLPNSRMKFLGNSEDEIEADLMDKGTDSLIDAEAYAKSAKHFMVDGAFNVNSTSVEAWKAILSSANGIDVAYLSDSGIRNKAVSEQSPFARMSLPGGTASDDWKGFRSLSDLEIANLAQAIVDQIKLRGPFVSLADFVNRRLSTDETGLMGPLQAAIDATNSINSNFSSQVTESDISASNIPYPEQATGDGAAAATGYLLQSDLLMSLGPVLSARSDTFTIRAYGDHVDQVTGQETTARCEAVVQRLPEYVDDSDDAELATDLLSSSENQKFGRRFVIRSIRWLD
jgi:hypothetical protein